MLFLVGYLGVGVEIPRGGRCVTSRRRMRPGSVRSSRVERIYDDLAFNLSSTKRTTLSFGILQSSQSGTTLIRYIYLLGNLSVIVMK